MNRNIREKLLQIGINVAHLLTASTSIRISCEKVGEFLFSYFPFSVRLVRIYVMDYNKKLMREEACFMKGSIMQWHASIPLHQLPSSIIENQIITTIDSGSGYKLLIPLHYQDELVGMLEFGVDEVLVKQTLTKDILYILEQMANTIALGLKHAKLQSNIKENQQLKSLIMRIGRNIQNLQQIDDVVKAFAHAVVDYLMFDRVSVFIFDPEEKDIAYNLCVNSRQEEYSLSNIPNLPVAIEKPLPLEYSVGYWFPLKSNTRDVGLILVDNPYTLFPIPEGVIDLLFLLCDQFASAVENIRLFYVLQKLAQHDELTGAYNYRAGLNALQQNVQMSDYDKTPFTICFLDINDLKKTNDTFGHSQGDYLIKTAVDILRSELDQTFTISRMGGDEFLIIFTRCRIAYAEKIWYNICKQIANINHLNIYPFNISFSHGMAEYDPYHPLLPEQLISIADKKMYAEKKLSKEKQKQIIKSYCTNL